VTAGPRALPGSLDDRDILDLAEHDCTPGPGERAIRLLAAAFPGTERETIAAAPLSARDRALLAVRARRFGDAIRCRERCARCGEVLELDLTAAAIGLAPTTPAFPPAPCATLPDGTAIRAVTAADMAAAETASDAAAARALLVALVAPGAADGPEIDAALEALDPAADVEIALPCPACGDTTMRAFDAAQFVWREIAARVPRILREVAELARAFHWSERDILALPPSRRALYLAEARR
jgi:hypothetical protein